MKQLALFRKNIQTLLADMGNGIVTVTHSGLAMVGLAVSVCVVVLALRPDYLVEGEAFVYNWLRERHVSLWWMPDNAVDRVTAADLSILPKSQADVATWLARKYRVAPEPLGALVAEAHVLAVSSKLPAHLILAVMAIESSFHPYVQSKAGAQGLMQVMPKVHAKRYEEFGGKLAAFDPITNLRVGVSVLVDCIKLKGGNVDDGLRFYLGGDSAAAGADGYVARVKAEQTNIDAVAAGQWVAVP
ncbi:lytic transglycosylase domain-containing protein [Limnohabitans sp. Rim8]|jgi:soluble lytic murein transglycosylase-like protein|uniref:lytic transglycosylase domain-containing protein n=1 Tax=Limnohabitans sp. Rim8 TaxID=1100718 RepID=UPI002616B598|nr:lytic transglycosylase domain-containing protein [Limnohabitans sp. Rim8]